MWNVRIEVLSKYTPKSDGEGVFNGLYLKYFSEQAYSRIPQAARLNRRKTVKKAGYLTPLISCAIGTIHGDKINKQIFDLQLFGPFWEKNEPIGAKTSLRAFMGECLM